MRGKVLSKSQRGFTLTQFMSFHEARLKKRETGLWLVTDASNDSTNQTQAGTTCFSRSRTSHSRIHNTSAETVFFCSQESILYG